ncbi:hypothetical protein [Candidatus Binatus sp.]|uniref:hypothetical protein n=1 Tax=Candidatus Binatus sp. TaxID=2811406 RepID=UPI003C3E4369
MKGGIFFALVFFGLLATATATVTPTPTPTASPTATPTATPTPAASNWAFTGFARAIGDIRMW